MCLILLSYDNHPNYQLILAANRDEYYSRPTAALDIWEDYPYVLAGRDLKSGGTWLGITRTGRLAAVTNYRDPASNRPDAKSRGKLVRDFLIGSAPPQHYLAKIQPTGAAFNGFNLLLWIDSQLWYYSNRGSRIQQLGRGLYGLSNHLLDTAWPKVVTGKQALSDYLAHIDYVDPEAIFAILADQSKPPDTLLPDTGVGLPCERILSSRFITSDIYGTRSSSIILVDRSGNVNFLERSFNPDAHRVIPNQTQTLSFQIEDRILPYRALS
jgi:uncharacterized protein with NRDE domain